jgi:hypothetical protein
MRLQYGAAAAAVSDADGGVGVRGVMLLLVGRVADARNGSQLAANRASNSSDGMVASGTRQYFTRSDLYNTVSSCDRMDAPDALSAPPGPRTTRRPTHSRAESKLSFVSGFTTDDSFFTRRRATAISAVSRWTLLRCAKVSTT